MKVRKWARSDFISYDERPGEWWHFAEIVEFLTNLPGTLAIRRAHGQCRPLLEYQVVDDTVPVFRVTINLKQDRCWVVLAVKQLPDYFRPVSSRMIKVPGRIYRVSETTYELDQRGVQLNVMITQIANSMIRSETGVCRSIAMRTLGWKTERKRRKKTNFNQFVDSLDGVIIVKYKVCECPRSDRFSFEHEGKIGEVVSFGWLHPTGVDVIQKFAYCELDATFYCLKPYVLSMPHFIYKNCSYPVGIFFGQSENCELYDLMYEAVAIFNKNSEKKVNFKFIVLSDRGSGLKSFCEKRKLPQFYCHRHLIEWFGTQSLMSAMMLKILRSCNFGEFLDNVKLSNEVLNRLFQQGRLSEETKKKYIMFTGQQRVYSPRMLAGLELPEEVWRWALWTRGCVTTCSNHVESFHRVLNQAVSGNGRRLGLLNSLREVRKAMENKQKEWHATFERNVKNQHKKGGGVCGEKENCTCWYSEQMARRYQSQIHFPCHHLCATSQEKQLQQFIEHGLRELSVVQISAVEGRYINVEEVPDDEPSEEKCPQQQTDLHDEELPDGSDDPIEEIARDIYWVVKPEIVDRLRKPFAWVFAWSFHAINSAQLDARKDRAQAYDIAWTAVEAEIRKKRRSQ